LLVSWLRCGRLCLGCPRCGFPGRLTPEHVQNNCLTCASSAHSSCNKDRHAAGSPFGPSSSSSAVAIDGALHSTANTVRQDVAIYLQGEATSGPLPPRVSERQNKRFHGGTCLKDWRRKYNDSACCLTRIWTRACAYAHCCSPDARELVVYVVRSDKPKIPQKHH
jgi:hypothetical protein